MKKIYLFMLFAVMFSMTVYAADKQALYIYRNDTTINAFYTYEIDSIRYSHYDLDSVWHDSIQVQEIWTEDSTYRIPLVVIDSASFITPMTKYQPGVKEISADLMDYVTGSDSMRIFLAANIPQSVMPSIGDRIVTTEMSEKFPIGFAGQVKSVLPSEDGYVVDCSLVPLTEIFESYCSYSNVKGSTENPSPNKPKKSLAWGINPIDYSHDAPLYIPPVTWTITGANLSVEMIAGTELNYGTEISLNITPKFNVKTFLLVTKKEGYYFNASITGDLIVEESASISGGVSWSKDIPLTDKAKYQIAPFVCLYYEPGIVLSASAQATLSSKATQTFKVAALYEWSSRGKQVLKPVASITLHKNDISVEGTLDGSVGIGKYDEIGLTLLHQDLDNISIRLEKGTQLKGNLMVFHADVEEAHVNTDFYDKCKEGKIAWDVYRSSSLGIKVGNLKTSIIDPKTITVNLREWNIVPTFSNTSFVSKSAISAEAQVEMEGDCLIPVEVGFEVVDEDNNEVGKMYSGSLFDHGHKRMEYTFSDLQENMPYTVYPFVRMFGHDIKGNPSATRDVHQWVKITDFAVTDSAYDAEQSFVYNNENYAYKFDCAVTVELNTKGKDVQVSDWGYAYIDPKGDTAYISLVEFNSPYEDKRYTYYRNESKSIVKLCGYIVFEGEAERYLEAIRVFPIVYNTYVCNDDNHQHMVDLGLPSGTLWSCMNLGATKPEEVGDYFAFGETSTKERFTDNNYLYYEPNGGNPYYSSIGANISGTVYDAATVNWGDDWRMPTLQEQQELLDNCTFELTTRNGVSGYLATGPNGNSIFLPFAPVKNNANYGAVTYYRSSFISSASLGNIYMAGTESISFMESKAPNLSHVCYRYLGAVIRPVKTKP